MSVDYNSNQENQMLKIKTPYLGYLKVSSRIEGDNPDVVEFDESEQIFLPVWSDY